MGTASDAEITNALAAPLIAGFADIVMPAANISRPGALVVPADLPPGSCWMELTYPSGIMKLATLDGDMTGVQVLMIAAHTPLPRAPGDTLTSDLIDMAVALYGTDPITGVTPRMIKAGPETMYMVSKSRAMELPFEGWFKLAVQLTFAVQ